MQEKQRSWPHESVSRLFRDLKQVEIDIKQVEIVFWGNIKPIFGTFVKGKRWYLSKGILQEGQEEFGGEAIPPAPPFAGVPGQRKLERFLV